MFKSYLITAWRNLIRDKFYASLNILGLAVGIICTILITLFVGHELSYDKHHLNYRRIYRLESDFLIAGKNDRFAVTAVPLGSTLKDEYPEIEQSVRFFNVDRSLIKANEHEFYEDGFWYTDSTIFGIFTHPFIYGSPEKALNEPNTVVLTEKLARKYYGDQDPVGQILTITGDADYRITGVIADLPDNSHLKFDGLLSVMTLVKVFGEARANDRSAGSFWNINPYTYVLLGEQANMQKVLDDSPNFYKKYMASLGDQINGSFNLMASPLAKLHYRGGLQADLPTGNMGTIYIFIAVAFFILLIACINYMNMATARASRRLREVGLRKTVGASRGTLIYQFLGESTLITLIALVISVGLLPLFLPVFNQIAGQNLHFGVIANFRLILLITAIALLTGLIAGSYPAFYLSGFQPAEVLKSQLVRMRASGFLRKVLVVIQFVISVVMIAGTIIVSHQLNYLRSKDPGFNKDNLLILRAQDTTFQKSVAAFREELLQNPAIENVATSTTIPGQGFGKVVFRVENNGELQEQALNFYMIDENYLDLMQIKLIDGRNFDRKMSTDLNEAFLINETAARQLNWGREALGKRMQWGIRVEGGAQRDGRVIGVINDFNYVSLHNSVEPLVLLLGQRELPVILIRIKPEEMQTAMAFVQEKWNKYNLKFPYEPRFMTDVIDEMYTDEIKLGRIFRTFAIITILISCLGLFGMSTFVTERRTKEIGIRKVIGASARNIVYHLSKEFIGMVLIADVIAVPLAWFVAGKWFSNFPYRIEIRIYYFLIAVLMSIIIALVTVSYQATKAALTDPARTLKYE